MFMTMKKMTTSLRFMAASLLLLAACKKSEPLTPDHENLQPLPEIPEEEALAPVDDVVTVMEDAYFARYCLARFDADGDGRLTMAEAEAAEAIVPAEDQPALLEDHYRFVSLDGIAYLPNLKRIEIKSSLISDLDLSRNAKVEQLSFDIPQGQARLERLVVRNTQLRELVLPNCELKELDLRNTPLESLNLEQGAAALSSLDLRYCSELRYLSCRGSQIASLELRYSPNLEYLALEDMPLQTLDLNNCAKLTELRINRTHLAGLTLKYNTTLRMLDLRENRLAKIDLTTLAGVVSVDVSSNPLTSLDISKCEKLTSLRADKTQISTLNTDNNTLLEVLSCGESKLHHLDLSTNPKLQRLDCHHNEMSELLINSDNNPHLAEVRCAENQFVSLDFSRCPITSWQEGSDPRVGSTFAPQPQLEVLTLPTHTLEVDLRQLTSCPKLRKVILQATQVPTLRYEAMERSQATLYVPNEALAAYEASPWYEAFTQIRAL